MRTFSKLLLAAGAIFAVVSCQTAEESFAPAGKLKVTASFENASTRVTYNIDNTSNTITPSWKVGDEIFGWDNTGVTFTFTCTEVVDNEAIFSYDPYEPAEGTTTLYAIYYPGKTATNIETGQLAVDLTAQEGSLDKDAPVLMSATATVSGENIHFSFHNDAVIVGLKKFKVGASDQVNSVTIKGLSATGTYEVKDGKLVLTPATMASDITATVGLTANTDGIVETPVYFAALPTAETSLTVSATTAAGTNYSSETSPKAFQEGKYYYMTKKLEEEAEELVYKVPEDYTIEAALAKAQESDSPCTIKLTDSCVVSVVNYTKGNTTIDLNGYAIKNDSTLFKVSGGSLTIVDSSADPVKKIGTGALYINKNYGSTSGNNGSVFIVNGGTVNLNSGKVYSTAGSGLWNHSFTITASAAEATININGGHVKAGSRVIQLAQSSTTYTATVNITGGLIQSGAKGTATSNTNPAIFFNSTAAGTLNISGGTIMAPANGYNAPIYSNKQNAKVYIFAGTDENGKETIPCLLGGANGYVFGQSDSTYDIYKTQTADGKPVKFYSNLTTYKNLPETFPVPQTLSSSHTDAHGNTFGYGVNIY